MKFKARIEVKLRREEIDPEAETVRKALIDLNFPVSQVKLAKIYEITLEASSKKDAESAARTMCSRLLVNPTKDEYKAEVVEVGGSGKS
jgi:phosphoribosylformylglycinamidine synthase PurS subunit